MTFFSYCTRAFLNRECRRPSQCVNVRCGLALRACRAAGNVPEDAMATLTINGKEITAPAGATILEAARLAGIDVPTLCWYPKLPVVGSCRICLVSVEGAPKLAAACATPAADGMKVTTE